MTEKYPPKVRRMRCVTSGCEASAEFQLQEHEVGGIYIFFKMCPVHALEWCKKHGLTLPEAPCTK